MDFFGFGTPSELTTPVGVMIKSATDNLRIGPDWSKNIEICDHINMHRDQMDAAIRGIRRRLMDNDHQTVSLSLTLLETCMKNCGVEFARHFDNNLMSEVVNIVVKENKGLRNKEDALRLIQQWGRSFEGRKSTFPIFFDTFMNLKARGVSFPPEDDKVTLGFENSGSASSSNTSVSPAPVSQRKPSTSTPIPVQEEDEFIRLQQDLSVVMEKVRLCREIMLVSPGIEEDEALADIIGFLEACRDRMVDVIESGTMGLLGEDLFALCLKVNDAISKTLDAEKYGLRIAVDDEDNQNQPKPKDENLSLVDLTVVPPPPSSNSSTASTDLLSLSPINSASSVVVPPPPPGNFVLPPPPSSSNAAPQNSATATTTLKPDDFECLFGPSSNTQTVTTFDVHASNSSNTELEDFFANLDVGH